MEEYRETLQMALLKAEEIAHWTGRIRDLLQNESFAGTPRDGMRC